jgi:hypothetical protein
MIIGLTVLTMVIGINLCASAEPEKTKKNPQGELTNGEKGSDEIKDNKTPENGQTEQKRKKGAYDELYDRERFNKVDGIIPGTVKDGYLDKDELRTAQKDFEYFLDDERFNHADRYPNDGKLSLDECKKEKQYEKEYHREIEERKYDELYDRERFNSANTDGKDGLSKEELRTAQKDFEYYLGDERFKHADRPPNGNGDGILSLDECKAERKWEKAHQKEIERKIIDEIKKKNGDSDIKDPEWLKKNPEAFGKLSQQRYWAHEHSDVINDVVADKDWVAKHPNAVKSVKKDKNQNAGTHKKAVRRPKKDSPKPGVKPAKNLGGRKNK